MADYANVAYGKPYSDGSGYEWFVGFERGLGGRADTITLEVLGGRLTFDPMLVDPADLALALHHVRQVMPETPAEAAGTTFLKVGKEPPAQEQDDATV